MLTPLNLDFILAITAFCFCQTWIESATSKETEQLPRNTTAIARSVQRISLLESDSTLIAGESLWSPDGALQLTMQSDGNFVLYRKCDNGAIWSSATNYPSNTPQSVIMQANGNLAIYNSKGFLLWSSHTAGTRFAGAQLQVNDEGIFCITKQGICLWNSGGFALCDPVPSPEFQEAKVILGPGDKLVQGQSVYSDQQTCNLTLQMDGNMVLTRKCDEAAIFSVNHGVGRTANLGVTIDGYVYSFGVAANGNLEFYWPNGTFKEVFNHIINPSSESDGADLRLTNDCALCLYKEDACLWTAHALMYSCPSANNSTSSKATPSSAHGGSQSQSGTIIGAVIGSIFLFVLIFCFPVTVYLKKRNHRRGGLTGMKRKWERTAANVYSVKPRAFPEENLQFRAACSRYIRLLEIPPDRLEFSNTVLGKGQYGIVYKALAYDLPTVSKSPTVVAAKTFAGAFDPQQASSFGEEFVVMLKCGRHINIVNILGIVQQDRPILLMEYCKFGSLLDFLKKRRDCFYSHTSQSGELLPFSQNDMEQQWVQLCKSREWEAEAETMADCMISTDDLIRFSHQISRGMEYLSSRFIIHRDLAARNILVAQGRILKISDFGLAKHGGDSYTVSNAFIALPILWMPPDAITTRQFSQKSDVWAFGVVLWEIFSLGLVPFDRPDVAKFSAAAFAEWLMEGNRLIRPENAPLKIYELMQTCWCLKPDNRPTFFELWKSLDELMSTTVDGSSYLALEEPEPDKRLVALDNVILSCLKSQTGGNVEDTTTDLEL